MKFPSFAAAFPASVLAALSLSTLMAACAPSTPPLRPAQPLRFQRQATDWYARLGPELQAYYAPAQGKQGLELFLALSEVVNRAQVLDYGDAMAFLYTAAEQRQQGKQSSVRAAYSELWIVGDGPRGHKYKEIGDANGDGKKGDAINCEHTWPQSFFNKTGAMRSDLHHLFPTLSTPNSKRGTLPFGLAREGRVSYATESGSQVITRSNGSAVFEPASSQKGNTARALLYFYLRYHGGAIRGGTYRSEDFLLGRLAQFQAWHQQDPVDAQEQRRHQLIAQRQGNRNPFVDIPNLLELIGFDSFERIEARFSGGR